MGTGYRMTIKSIDDVKKVAEMNEIPSLSTTKAYHPQVSVHMNMINTMVMICNQQKSSTLSLENLCQAVLESGEMYYAEVSKFEVCVILAKCRSMRGEDMQEAFMNIVRGCFNEIPTEGN